MEGLIVRRATTEDLPTLLRFEQGVIAAERPFDQTLKQEHTTYYDLNGLINSSQALLLVAEKEQEVISSGYARMEAAKPYLQHTQYAYLGFMYTAPLYRGRGINRLIMDALEKWSSEQGVTELRLDVYYDNEPAIKAYEKAGYKKHMIEMRKKAGDGSNT